jgi:Zn ribbon nucleic-acid-binding protein
VDISKVKLGEIIEGLKCPRCHKTGNIVLRGLYRKEEESHELECSCFFTARVNPKDFNLTYESKAEKEERLETEKEEKKKEKKGRR